MGEEGEKVCPLCTEEMDPTDQQLKPCKCGYQICVWCWHHIMDMAEKDDTEGRCPACRTPYDKEKIVGTAANCERLVAEINSERKQKSHKSKSKTSEGRKHLTSIRVIQRNLVYVMGIPSNLADEDVLQRKEYFAQYGKVLKVSISRTSGGAIQHSSNNTFNVYITYSKEEEAVRCIQSVHGYVLDDKPLRACFGTTKYCHAWLRNMSCSNPDCLYLHEIGTEEDSFSKDEIVSAFTRSRVQQITAATNNMHQRSGSTLPPPLDDFCSNEAASAKPIPASVLNNPAPQSRISPPNSSSGRSTTLPAAASWGSRVPNGRPLSASCSDGPTKQKPDNLSPPVVARSNQVSTSTTDFGKRPAVKEESNSNSNGLVKEWDLSKQSTLRDSQTDISNGLAKVVCSTSSTSSTDGEIAADEQTHIVASSKDGNVARNNTVQGLCSGLSSIGLDNQFDVEHSDTVDTVSSLHAFRSHENDAMECTTDPLTSLPSGEPTLSDDFSNSRGLSTQRLESPRQVINDVQSGVEDKAPTFDERNLDISEAANSSSMRHFSNSLRVSDAYSGHYDQHGDVNSNSNLDNPVPSPRSVHLKEVLTPFAYGNPIASGSNENKVSSPFELGNSFNYSNFPSDKEEGKYLGRFNDDPAAAVRNASLDMGESSIISNILSLDNDAWHNSLTSPHHLSKLLSESDKSHGSLKISNSWWGQSSNQSRFSFARQEDFQSNVEPAFSNFGHITGTHSNNQNFPGSRDPYLDRLRNGFSSSILEEHANFPSSQFTMPADTLSASRPQISAPPGFSLPSRSPPPGFPSQEKMGQTFDPFSGHRLFESSSILNNQYSPQNTTGIEDPEFIDPAIMAVVGKGRRPNGMNGLGLDMRSTYTPQLSVSPETDPRLHHLMQQSLSSNQNTRFSSHVGDRFSSHVGDRFSPLTDAYRSSSRFPDQTHMANHSHFGQTSFHQSRSPPLSNGGHWDSWNEVQNPNDLLMAELLRNERLGVNHFTGYEDLKYQRMPPSSADIFNRAYRM